MTRSLWVLVGLVVAAETLDTYVGCVGFTAAAQQDEPEQPHTTDPERCVKYCYPKGGDASMRPKGVPEGISGYECKGDRCSHINEDHEGESDRCSEKGNDESNPSSGACSTYCAKRCCSCLATCV